MSDVGPATADIRSCPPPEDVARLASTDCTATPATNTTADPGRRRRGPFKRGAAACQRCRRRKQKCDGKLPVCGPCSAAGSPCVPSERLVVVRADPDCRCAALRERVRELEARIEALVARDASRASYDPVENQQQHRQQRQGSSCCSSPADEGRRRHRHRSRILGPTFPGSSSGSESVPGPVLRSSPWKLWANDPDGQTPPPPPPPQLPPSSSYPSPSSSCATAADLPTFAHAESLVEAFFTRRWPHLPVLHKPTFLERDFLPVFACDGSGGGGGGGGGRAGRLSSFRVHMVLAIASAETSTNASPPHSQQHHCHHHGHFFAAAVRDLDLVLDGGPSSSAAAADAAPRGERDLESIQCLLLLCLYGANEPQAVDVWHTLGLALRLAVGMDLHREEASSPPPPPTHPSSSFSSSSAAFNTGGTGSGREHPLLRREMARRLFWSVYVMDRSMSMAMGRPLGIQDSDITVPFPLLLTDEQLTQEQEPEQEPALPCATNPPSPRDMSTFVHVIKLRRINAAIHDSLHAAAAGKRPHATDHEHGRGQGHDREEALQALRTAHHADLEAWLVSAPRYPPGSTTAMLQTPEWFQIAHHQAVLSLYRPSRHLLPTPSTTLSLSLPNLRLYLDAAIGLVSSYASLRARNRVTYTFVALNALFLASVAMLHALRASPALRADLGRDAAAANVDTCVRLLRGLSPGRAVGARCAGVVARLGAATLGVFDRGGGCAGGGEEEGDDDDVDEEFMAWFGLKLQRTSHGAPHPHHQNQNHPPHHHHPPPPLATTTPIITANPLPVAALDVMGTTHSTPSIDIPWNDFLDQGFDIGGGYLGFDV